MSARVGLCLAVLLMQAPGTLDRGLAAFRARRWAEAEAEFRRAVRESPRSAPAWNFLGMVYAAQEQYLRSVDPFRRACDLDPSSEGACYHLGRALYSINRFAESRKAFEIALRRAGDKARTLHGLALTLEALGDAARAERCYREASQAGDPATLKDYGMFLYRAGRAAEALELLRRAGASAEAERVAHAVKASPQGRRAASVPVEFETSALEGVVSNGAFGNKHQVETMLAGVAVLDYDADGWPDIFVANGAEVLSLQKTGPAFHNRLYHNNRDGTFTDVTAAAGVAGEGYSMGVAAADFDNDGWTDLFVAGVGRNTLYRNRSGVFEDISARAGVLENGGWTIAAGWFDYDNDGLLDLFVARYVAWDPEKEPYCGDPRPGYRAYCHPKYYTALPDALYHNQGDGTFRDVSEESGIAAHPGKGMGVVFADYDHDGRMDVFVANDTVPNFLFHNEGHGRFRECAMEAGVALNEAGIALSSMGADFRDYDNDGREDLFVTALTNERFVLFRNVAAGRFVDVSGPSLIATQSLPWSGWSTGLFDLNNDGFKDVFAAQGNVMDNAELTSSRTSRQPNAVYLNQGDGTFLIELLPGNAFHRGVAFGDFDRDGRVDAVVTRLNEKPLILWNRTRGAGNWLALRLEGTKSNRDAIGARVHIVADGGEQWNRVTTSTGFASSSDRAVHFGLGADTRVRLIEIEWPSGRRQRMENVEGNRFVDVREP